tara:strand:- start:2259 stop:3473 length:1215 start_codon:yes stop_codon:yes gene_type:complete
MKLTTESKKIMKYLKDNTSHIEYPLQSSAINILKEIYTDMISAEEFITNQAPEKHAFTKEISNKSNIPKPKTFNYSSFPKKIREFIDNNALYETTYSVSLFGRQIKIVFVTETHSADGQLNRFVDAILCWLFILNKYSSKFCCKAITIYLYFTSHMKCLPVTSEEVLDAIHVNSAFTRTCPVESEIVIFRKEEWFKVFIHETFHNFGLDFSDSNNKISKHEILKMFPVKSEVNAYEGYTECWAEIINVSFCSLHLIKARTFKEFLETFKVLMCYEIKYSFFQLTKILGFMGLKYRELFKNSNSSKRELFKEHTNVLAYYVIKTVLLNNFEGFLSWCKKNNTNLLQFKKTPSNEMSFCNFVKHNFKSDTMINNVDIMEDLNYNDKCGNNKKFMADNLRMTVCELC